MNVDYGRDLDLNLLRVLVAVADEGSVTTAAARLYLTQPAVSAALRRLTNAIGAPLFVRQGRGLVLTSRGARLVAVVRPHLAALLDAALSPPTFDPRTSERVVRLGVSDATEGWLLPALLRVLVNEAPRMSLVAVPVQFRNVGDAIASGRVDAAITVADELPSNVRRIPLFSGGFVCLYDPRHARVKRPFRERDYFAHEHVIVSYAGDLRGIVEDMLHKTRRVRCSVSSFENVGAIVEGTALLATIPAMVAEQIKKTRPRLRTAPLPFHLEGTASELLWSVAAEDDPAIAFVRTKIVAVVKESMPSPRAIGGARAASHRA